MPGLLARTIRIPAGGAAGINAAMPCPPRPAAGACSSSSPSTTSTSRPPARWQAVAASASRPGKSSARVSADTATGGSCPSSAHNCPDTASRNASRVSCQARQAVTKNDTSQTRPVSSAGGLRTKVDRRAVLPAHGPVCHHAYGPWLSPRQKRTSSATSASRPRSSCGGGIRSTWRR